ncbi:MAG: alpha/beta hydrolase [Myxococcaceae bacterium]|nr:alpha/beta hydrolase [Myxococcaceae bacterium]
MTPWLRRALAVGLGLLAACRSTGPTGGGAPPACQELSGGTRLTTGDGVSLWFKVIEGSATADTLLYLHGGPGHHSLDFERAVAGQLRGRLVLMDQRGCGRSQLGPGSAVGLEPTVEDVERVLEATQTQRAVLVAHSFGASVAVAFARARPHLVRGIVFVDTNADTNAAFTHQLQTLAATPEFAADHPRLEALVSSQTSVFGRLVEAYQLVGVEAAQRRLQWHDEAARQAHRRAEAEDGLDRCTDRRVVEAYAASGHLDGQHARELGERLPMPAVVFAGRHSQTIGPSVVRDADAWGAGLVWFEQSAHFPFLEERPRFVAELERFVATLPP